MATPLSRHLSLVFWVMFAGLAWAALPCPARTITQPAGELSVSVFKSSQYSVQSAKPAWTYSGQVNGYVKNITGAHGADALGNYQQINFAWQEGPLPMTGWIRLYDDRPVVLCSDTCGLASGQPPGAFPAFTRVPANLHVFSYGQKTFAPPQFAPGECSTPWLLFDDHFNSMIISPASHFMVASLSGDGRHLIASGMNPHLTGLPAGFTQQTLIVFGHGINQTWDAWGAAMTGWQGVKRPANDADIILKYLGYWTDNGAYYYYNYDPGAGYAGTLLALEKYHRQAKIPIHYMQLDSWWYEKSFAGPDGKLGKTKAPRLPEGEWNRYGGLLDYQADPFVFPDGLAAFHQAVALPFVTHNRWVDLNSPYRDRFKISGVAAVDRGWWNEIAGYLKDSGVVTYEQDWLDRIYQYSPAFSTNADTGAEFMDDMAGACRSNGLTMQYCMPCPCHFMQGCRYDNLTTTRVSDDKFGPARYNNFLYTSRLAAALGIWPWTDVFKSTDVNNLLLATLSAGPVGIGDAMGAENMFNLSQSVRADGVIVKPDAPIVPLDQSYLADAGTNPVPLLASTYTDNGLRTVYLFAFNRSDAKAGPVSICFASLDLPGAVCLYDYFGKSVQRFAAGGEIKFSQSGQGATAYYVIAPVGRSGVAFFGDQDKFVANGRQRIASLQDAPGQLGVVVNFAPDEGPVTLHGVAARRPTAGLKDGRALPLNYEPASGHFTIRVAPDPTAPVDGSGSDPVRQVSLAIKTAPH